LDRIVTVNGLILFVLGVALGYLVRWARQAGYLPDLFIRNKGFRPRVGFSRLDGMASVSLLLANGSQEQVWVEEIEIHLSSLVAIEQAIEPSFHEVKKIRQMIPPGDMLPVSLAQAIYKAAGNPQRRYTCVLSSVLRYKIGEKSSEKTMPNYRIQMAGLTADNIARERKPIPAFGARNRPPQDIPAVTSKLK